MVKIKIRHIVLMFAIFIFLMGTAYAAGSKLIFSDVDVKVGSKTSKNLDPGDTIDDEAEPGDTVEFRIEVRNNFTSAENLDIEDITVETTIEEIDDGDDLDDESKEFDLRPGNDKRITMKFQVPIEIEEDTFNVLIEADGEDENGTDHRASMRLRLEVDKETHLIKITRKAISPADISCNRRNVQVGIEAINIGNEDEEDVTIQVYNPELGIDIKETVDELTAEPNEDESKFSKTFSFNAPQDAEAGTYIIALRAIYDNDRRKAEETVTLNVNDCATSKSEEKTKQGEEQTQEEVQVITPPPKKQAQVPVQTVPEGTVVTQESFLKSNAFLAVVIVVMLIAVIIGIALIATLFRR